MSLTEGFSSWDGRSAAGAALEDEGPGGGAGRWVGVQVLTGLLGHDQLVLRLPVDHRFPVAHLRKRAAGHSKQPPSHQALGYVDFSNRFVCPDRIGTIRMYSTCMAAVCFDALCDAKSFLMREFAGRCG